MLAQDEKLKFFIFHTKIAYHAVRNAVGFFSWKIYLIPENNEMERKKKYYRTKNRLG